MTRYATQRFAVNVPWWATVRGSAKRETGHDTRKRAEKKLHDSWHDSKHRDMSLSLPSPLSFSFLAPSLHGRTPHAWVCCVPTATTMTNDDEEDSLSWLFSPHSGITPHHLPPSDCSQTMLNVLNETYINAPNNDHTQHSSCPNQQHPHHGVSSHVMCVSILI